MRRSPAIAPPAPTEAEIQKEAYYLWLENGCPVGRDLENWLAAKELLLHRHGHGGGRFRRRAPLSAPPSPARQLGANN